MSLLKTLQIEHIPKSHPVHIALFKNVKNAPFLRQQLLAGNSDFEYAFIDASTIVSTIHALAATHQAIRNLLDNRLRTRNVHSEIVFVLSPNNNITESFRRFGITDSTTSLLCIKVSTSPEITTESVRAHLEEFIEGTAVEFSDEVLWGPGGGMVCLEKVAKNYKMKLAGNGNRGKGRNKEQEEEGWKGVERMKKVEVDILGCMVMRAVG